MTLATRGVLWVAALGLAACGRVAATETGPNPGQAGTSSGGGGGSSGASEAGVSSDCTPARSLVPARIMLLTDTQYANTVRDVFGVDIGHEITAANLGSTGTYPVEQPEL